MPCTYTGSLDGDKALFAQEELDLRERMLCAVCRELERMLGNDAAAQVLFNAEMAAKGIRGGQIQKWWAAHREADGKRGKSK